MNFFEQQDRTRRNSKVLVLLFALAVIAIVLAIYYASTWIYFIAKAELGEPVVYVLWDPVLFSWVTLSTLAVIASGSLYMTYLLSAGGPAVAKRLGGNLVLPSTRDPKERKLLNVVEEIAIASGAPVPSVYLFPNEQGINAFAAGFTPSDAVLGVTGGALSTLSRDELQGVIAHEFSHIVNGDTKLNLRLASILHGILIIGLTGYWILRAMGRGRSNRRSGGGIAIVGLVGIILCIIGFVGLFFGRLIKSGVSRQREFLADAAGVQFTRNPLGLAGALKKIGGYIFGSNVLSSHAEEMNHMFFESPFARSWFGWLSTHPPLAERIKLLEPTFTGSFPEVLSKEMAEDDIPVSSFLEHVGRPTDQHISYAQQLLPSLPDPIRDAAHSPLEAKAVIYLLLLASDDSTRSKQLVQLQSNEPPPVVNTVLTLQEALKNLDRSTFLPLIDLSLPALRQLSLEQFNTFYKAVKALILIDQKVSMFEFTVLKIIRRHVGARFTKTRKGKVRYHSLHSIAPSLQLLLSSMAYMGGEMQASAAFLKGLEALKSKELQLLPKKDCDLIKLHRALDDLTMAAPLLKREILEASAAVIGGDGKIDIEEAELLRAVGDTLDTPIPPIVGP